MTTIKCLKEGYYAVLSLNKARWCVDNKAPFYIEKKHMQIFIRKKHILICVSADCKSYWSADSAKHHLPLSKRDSKFKGFKFQLELKVEGNLNQHKKSITNN